MSTLTTSIQELTNNPLNVIHNLQYHSVGITQNNKTLFYCVNEKEFLEFLSFKQQETIKKPKKSIREFGGVLKNETDVKLSIDELNNAIQMTGAYLGIQGIKDEWSSVAKTYHNRH